MYLKEYLEKYNNKKVKLFVDMDGVIVDIISYDIVLSSFAISSSVIKLLSQI